MSRIDINRPFDVFGEFWVPGHDDKTARGRMYRDETGIRIQLFDDLRPGPSFVPVPGSENSSWEVVDSPDIDVPLTIHGRLGGMLGPVTATECLTMRSSVVMFGSGPQEYVLRPSNVIVGGHVGDRTHTYTGVRVKLHHLDEWATLPGFAFEFSRDPMKINLYYDEPTIDSVDLTSGAKLTISQHVSFPRVTQSGGSINRSAQLRIAELGELTWQEISRSILRPLESLLTLCLGVQCKVSGVELTDDGQRWMQLTGSWLRADPTDAEVDRPFVTLRDIGLPAVARWLDKVERFGPLPPVVARFSAKQQIVHLDTELLEMTTVAEGLHARLFPEAVRMDTKTTERVRAAIIEAVLAEEQNVRDIIQGVCSFLDAPGYPMRLKQLAGLVKDCAPEITGKANRWARHVTEARNSYAHRTKGFLNEEDIDVLATVTESLRWLLRSILLLEAGVSKEHLAERLRESSAYRFFRERAKESLPKVYDDQQDP